MQAVNLMGSPLKNDLVLPNAYDEFGREAFKYLPYVSIESNGWYKENALKDPDNTATDAVQKYRSGKQYEFYQTSSGDIAQDPFPYAQTIFDLSPLNRMVKQGASGEVWQPNADPLSMDDKTVKKKYETNVPGEVFLFTYDETTGLVNLSNDTNEKFYQPNELYTNKTYDEHNNEVIEYVDKEGRTVCKKIQYKTETDGTKQYASTYYIYDNFGNLVVVLPPEAVKELSAL